MQEQGRLMGVLVTSEYLDLFDAKAYWQDNLSFSGGSLQGKGDPDAYQGRLYAALGERTLTDENGQTSQIQEYRFEGIEGIPYFSVKEEGSFLDISSDEAVDRRIEFHDGDDEETISLTGTIYISAAKASTYYMNPVYQDATGVYVMSGSSINLVSAGSEGSSFSHTLQETNTITENGHTKTVSTQVEISLEVKNPPERHVILQMDGNSQLLSRQEYRAGAMPAELIPEKNAEYLLLESYTHDGSVTRTLYTPEDCALYGFYSREDGICVKQWTQLAWKES